MTFSQKIIKTVNNPEVTVITTCFNESISVFQRSFNSILTQSLKNIEYLIYPGNPDNKILIEFLIDFEKKDKRIKVIYPTKKQKSTYCLNELIKIAKADFIAIQEADDCAYSDRILKQKAFLESIPDSGACSSSVRYVQEETGKTLFIRKFPYLVGSEINRFQPINTACAMFKKSTFEKGGMFNEDLNNENVQDYDLWLKLYTNGIKLYNLDEVLFDYYTSNNNVRNRKPKSVLWYTMLVKYKYRKQLNFKFIDWLYLIMEYCVWLLPSFLIKILFNFLYKIKQ